MWTNKPASGNALVKDNAIIGYEITSGGAGYGSPPTVSVANFNGPAPKVELPYGKDLSTNGSVSAITVLH